MMPSRITWRVSSIPPSTTSAAAPPASNTAGSAPQRAVIVGSGLIALGLAGTLAGSGPRLAILLAIGIGCGATLYHAALGFTSAYRRLLVARDASGVEAQLLMLAVATLLFAPALASGTSFGTPVIGANAPVGWQVAIGAFIFGLGMQLGDGCGSGTLYKVGGGSARMVVTLVTFCAGGFWASLHMAAWQGLPNLGTIVLGETMGWGAAAATQLAFLAMLYVVLRTLRREKIAGRSLPTPGWRRIATGPWPLAVGALLLALLNLATLAVAGHPWSITWGFTLWGAKMARFAGWNSAGDGFWSGDFQREALEAPILHDITSVMNIGIILGAVLASGLAGRFGTTVRIPLRSLVAAALGGLLMGYGARIAYGCNIGAFFSGVASTSLHGWLWIAAALVGTSLGIRLRPAFHLSNG